MALDEQLLPENYTDYPEEAKDSFWEYEVSVETIATALIDEYDLPGDTRSDGALRREQWVALARALMDGDSE